MFPEVSGSGLRGYSFTSEIGSLGSEDVEGECDPAAMFAAGRISWRSVIAHCLGWFKWLRIPFDRQNYAHLDLACMLECQGRGLTQDLAAR
jgi:hypothetical protein